MITMYADKVFRGQTVRQEIPTCECGKFYEADRLTDAPGVFFKEIEVFGRKFTLIEPVCPICNKKIVAQYNVLN